MKDKWFVVEVVAIFIGGRIAFDELLFLVTLFSGGFYDGTVYSSYVGDTYIKELFRDGPQLLFGLALVLLGMTGIMRSRRYRFYQSLVTTRDYVTVEELARETGYGRRLIARDMRGMIRAKQLPGAKMDALRGCVMLKPQVWQEYEAERKNWEFTRLKLRAAGVGLEDYLAFTQTVEQLADVRKWNGKIQDEEMKKKIAAAVERLSAIREEIQDAPDKFYTYGRVYRFYLPQLLLLTRQYAQLETLGVKVQDSDCAGEIRKVLTAFP